MRVRRRHLVAVLLSGAVLASLSYLATRGVAVAVVVPVRGAVTQTVVSSGRVLPPAEINIGALVVSTVREVYVKEGDPVTVGQVLVQLDDRELRAALDQAQAAVGQARAGRYEIAKLSGPEAQANLSRAEASLVQAKSKLKTSEGLFAGGAGTRGEVDDARTALHVAQAQHDAAQLQLQATKGSGSRSVMAAAAVAAAKAQVAVVEAQLARARIVSPVDGVVLERHLEPGDAVVAGSRMLLLSRTGETRLLIEPDERNLALLALGQEATASAEAFPKERFDAVLRYIAPAVDPLRGTVEVHLHVPTPPAYLRPHMTVSVEIEVGRRDEVLTVPRGAVRELAGASPHVFVVVEGKAVRVDVELGAAGDERVEIASGLEETARVVDTPPPDLAPGDRVRTSKGGT
ncbi:MAG: efflux RND transporter periplasmic adaptor subunit [Polyangiaceae bacterium]|nr:efflux RND transporter periplasmic adaptor subunit [Polyangiaceae bacterium]